MLVGIRDPGSGIRDPGSGIRDPRAGTYLLGNIVADVDRRSSFPRDRRGA
jgi:hypothetical protein